MCFPKQSIRKQQKKGGAESANALAILVIRSWTDIQRGGEKSRTSTGGDAALQVRVTGGGWPEWGQGDTWSSLAG